MSEEQDCSAGSVGLRQAVKVYFDLWDRCGGSTAVAAEAFADARQAMRDALTDTGPQPAQDPLAIIEDGCWDLRCRDVPTGGDDYDIVWDIIEHHQAPPKERVVGTGRSPREALCDATSTLTRPHRKSEGE